LNPWLALAPQEKKTKIATKTKQSHTFIPIGEEQAREVIFILIRKQYKLRDKHPCW